MAAEWAKWFYNSKLWKKTRKLALIRDHYECQHCGDPGNEVDHITELTPENIHDHNISLNLENLQTLCGECHKTKTREDKTGKKRKGCSDGLKFDADGNLVEG